MSTTLDNVEEDLLFYNELKQYAFGALDQIIDNHHKELITHGILQIDQILELAISKVGNIARHSTVGRDFVDGSDAKKVTSNFRNNNKSKGIWTNSYKVQNIHTKTGKLRIMGYNRVLSKFNYYVIPYFAYCHLNGKTLDITLDLFTNYCNSTPIPTGCSASCKWTAFECKDFTDMATR